MQNVMSLARTSARVVGEVWRGQCVNICIQYYMMAIVWATLMRRAQREREREINENTLAGTVMFISLQFFFLLLFFIKCRWKKWNAFLRSVAAYSRSFLAHLVCIYFWSNFLDVVWQKN